MIQKDIEKEKQQVETVYKPKTKAQMQAWFENWTLFVIKGMIGHLSSLLYHSNKYEAPYATRLWYIRKECELLCCKIKEEQAKRQEEKKGKKDENLNQL